MPDRGRATMLDMTDADRAPAAPWALAGAVTGLSGLATSYLAAHAAGGEETPVAAVAEQVIRLTPGGVAERAIAAVGHADKPILVAGVIVVVTLLSALVGLLARRAAGQALAAAAYAVLAAPGLAAVLAQPGGHLPGVVGVAVGYVTWLLVLALLAGPLRRLEARAADPGDPADPADPAAELARRAFLLRTGLVVGGAVVAAYAGRIVGRGRRRVEAARRALRLAGVTTPPAVAGADLEVAHQPPWVTPVADFYRIDTAIVPPAVDPSGWRLRLHGLVERPIELTFEELLSRPRTQAWVTLNCVSNGVGGDLIGNAWWSGVRIAPLLAEAGVHPDADGVLQTSADGWTCLTPLDVLTDDRAAMLAVAQNGEPLTVEHGFPVRMVVPGLYGYVSATKWLVDLEVTRFADAQGYWTDKGWSARGPVKLGSRIDVPRSGAEVDVGDLVVAGTAWQQHTGIAAVEVSLDGGPWRDADLGRVPDVDTWVQWRTAVRVERGDHRLRVRARSAAGELQTAARAAPAPDGATGWHTVEFHVS